MIGEVSRVQRFAKQAGFGESVKQCINKNNDAYSKRAVYSTLIGILSTAHSNGVNVL